MRKLSILLMCIALIASACGDGDDTTTSEGESPPEAVEDTGPNCLTSDAELETGYPWVGEKRTPSNNGSIVEALDDITYCNGATHQVPCDDCVQEERGSLEFYGGGDNLCDHPVQYVDNELVVVGPQDAYVEAFEAIGLNAIAADVTDSRAGEKEYEPPADFHLLSFASQSNSDPIDILVDLMDEGLGEEFDASPNYVYRATPKWIGSPGDDPTPAEPTGMVEEAIFEVEPGSILVVDDFSRTGTPTGAPIGWHGEFIANLIDSLTGKPPEQSNIDLTGSSVEAGDSLSLMAAIDAGISTDVSVVNMSFGTYLCRLVDDPDSEFHDIGFLVELQKLDEEGMLDDVQIVAAAGNDGHGPDDPLFYPAGLGGVTSVGALGWSPGDERWYAADFTNDFEFNVWAPGVAIVSTMSDEAFAWSGTSFAAPHVAACSAAGMC